MVQNDPTAVVQDVDQVENQGEEEMEFVDNKSTGGPEVDMNNISNCRKTEIENDEEGWFMVCKSEIDGKIESATFYFNNLDDAYEWKKHFNKSIEPLIVEQNKEHLI